jgi:tetratricopeptide (TPR) repeat protein
MLPAQSYRDMAREAALKGENEEAVALYEKTLAAALKVFKEEDFEVVRAHGELGEAYRAVGKWKEAITQLDYAWKRARYDAESKQHWLTAEGDLAMGFAEKLGRTCQAATRYEDAVMVFKTAVADAERVKRDEQEVIGYLALYADTLLLLQRNGEADQAVQRAVQLAEHRHAKNPLDQAQVFSTLGMVYYRQKRYEKAEPLAQRALQLAEENKPAGDKLIATYRADLGSNLLHLPNRLEEANKLLHEAMEVLQKALKPDDEEFMPLQQDLVSLSLLENKPDEAMAHAEEAWRLCKLHYPAEHPETARTLALLGKTLERLKQTDKAQSCYEKARDIFEATLGKDHPQTLEMKENLARLK